MTFGISTACLYPAETEAALSEIVRLGASDTEIFFNAECELSGPLLRRIRQIREESGVRVAAVHPFTTGFEPFMLFSEYLRRFEDTLEQYKKFAYAAAELRAPYIVIHGDIRKGRISEEEYFDRFARLREVCLACGAEPVQENVSLFRSASPAFIERMKRAFSGDVGFVLDIKQCVRAGVDPFLMAQAMSGNIVHVHLSDHLPEQSCLLPGKGAFPFGKLFSLLREQGYGGSLLIEVYRAQFGAPEELRDALRMLIAQAV